MKTIRIGTGAGFSGDRIEPAVDLAAKGNLDYLIFECLAERTIALAQQAKMHDPNAGFDPLLERRMRAVLPICREKGVRVISNMGAANPVAAAKHTIKIARELGLSGLRVAAVQGDNVLDVLSPDAFVIDEANCTLGEFKKEVISANAYLGAGGIVDALKAGADVVLTGRAADPAMFLAPQIFEFGWQMDDWTRLGRGTLVGHLLECGGQVTGGYFADPGLKDVPDLANLGFPIAEVDEDGNAVITKLPGTGGFVNAATCKEQLLYEVHDPKRYIQPDVIADFSSVQITEVGPDRVAVSNGDGLPKTGSLKVSIGYIDSCVGEGQISYAGPGAAERGQLALDILHQRIEQIGIACDEVRGELIGVNSIFKDVAASECAPSEVRVRFVVRTRDLQTAARIGEEVESLYLNGPAGGGGVTKSTREIVAIVSGLLPEDRLVTRFEMMEA
ncbi:ABC transporter substrate-binding protein [Thalassospira tepidiphila]|uniref:acyclic terpene utilization AtuA family protein n=1 Tax=Thalassospira tepidiphila TaxID=393657 RepID=UPI0029234E65|nr:ABC transporter substrate-binding protein [Thalassospira tepidiphila]